MTDQYPVEQLTQAELDHMKPQEILDARAAGHLDQLLGVPADDVVSRARAGQMLTAADLAALNRRGRPDLVLEARDNNRVTPTTTTEETR